MASVKQGKQLKGCIYLIAFLFDCYLLISFLIVITGAIFLPSEWQTAFGSSPKSYRIVLHLVTLAALGTAGFLHLTGRLTRYSRLITYIQKWRWNGIYWVLLIYGWAGITLCASSLLRHFVFESNFDFAIFAQAVWNTWRGVFLYSSIKGGICLLGDHVSPILALLSPLYGLWNDPAVLLVFQALASASAVFPVYLIAKEVLKRDRWAILFAVAFALYAPVRNAVRFDFHPEVIGDPLLLWAFYFIVLKRLRIASVFLVLVLMTKEVACGPVAMLGLYCWWFRGHAVFGIAWFLAAVGAFFFDVAWLAPYLSHQDYFYSGNYLRWKEAGMGAFLGHLFDASTFTYLKKIFLPLGFLSWLSPRHLVLTVPTLAQNLLTAGLLPRSTFFQYTSFLTSTTFISAIYGLHNLLGWLAKKQLQRFSYLVVYFLLGASVMSQTTPELRMIRDFAVKDNPHFKEIRAYLRAVPEDWTVRTHLFFSPHLARRRELHIYENGHPREGGSLKAQNAAYVIIDREFLEGDAEKHLKQLYDRGYKVIYEKDGFQVLKK